MFLTLALHEGELVSFISQVSLSLVKEIHWMGSWMGLKARLDVTAKRKNSTPARGDIYIYFTHYK